MSDKPFASYAANENHPDYDRLTARRTELYARPDEVRSPFARDYTRILHCTAYRRLKHKTQVFYNVGNDHICTRMEHVLHVESVSGTIAKHLGLNDELTKAISMGHDLGHAPFGHQGEMILSHLCEEHLNESFWHEKNGLRFVDKIELLEDNYKVSKNLDLTYAVRDGIISHCGEVDEPVLVPRDRLMNLDEFTTPGQFMPATWEGCLVKLADKIAYVGRDIEDAISLGFLDGHTKAKLLELARVNDCNVLNSTVIMHNMIIDVCRESTPDKGIRLSEKFLDQLNIIKRFNTENIYSNERFQTYKAYTELIINELFRVLMSCECGEHSLEKIQSKCGEYGDLFDLFLEFVIKYCDEEYIAELGLADPKGKRSNEKLYGKFDTHEIYVRAVIDYISGMTDSFAIKSFDRLITF